MDVPKSYWWILYFICFEWVLTLGRWWDRQYLPSQGRVGLCLLLHYRSKLVIYCESQFFFPGWNRTFVGYNTGWLTLEYMLSACLNCNEKKRKMSTPWRMSKVMPSFADKAIHIIGRLRFVMTMRRSSNGISPTSKWSSTVAPGVAKCSLATNSWKSGVGPSFRKVCYASNRPYFSPASEMSPVSAPLSMRPSMLNSTEINGR